MDVGFYLFCSEEEVGFGDVSPPNSDPEDWGDDFASPVVNKLGNGVPAKSFEGLEIGDGDDDDDDDAFFVDDDDDDMETDDNNRQDNQQQQQKQQLQQKPSGHAATETNGGREEMDEDWGDAFAETELEGKLGSRLTSVGDDDDEEGDDEFEELKQKVAHTDAGSKPPVDDEDEDWGMDEDDNNGKAVHVRSRYPILTSLRHHRHHRRRRPPHRRHGRHHHYHRHRHGVMRDITHIIQR
jgi:hypothetical protein